MKDNKCSITNAVQAYKSFLINTIQVLLFLYMPNYHISQLCGGGKNIGEVRKLRQPFANALPNNYFPLSLIYSLGACFYNLVLERELELSDCLPVIDLVITSIRIVAITNLYLAFTFHIS